MKKLPDYCEISQQGDCDFTCTFDEGKLDLLVKSLHIYKRKRLSKEERERLSQFMKDLNHGKITV